MRDGSQQPGLGSIGNGSSCQNALEQADAPRCAAGTIWHLAWSVA